METRRRKRRHVVDSSSEDEFIELDGSESDDVMCSQPFDDEVPGDRENSDNEILSDVSFFLFFPFFSFSCLFTLMFLVIFCFS